MFDECVFSLDNFLCLFVAVVLLFLGACVIPGCSSAGAAEQPRAAAPRGAPGPPAERETAHPSFCSATKAVFPADPPKRALGCRRLRGPGSELAEAGGRSAARAPSQAAGAFRSAAPPEALPPVCSHHPFRRLSSYGRRGSGGVLLSLALVEGACSARP